MNIAIILAGGVGNRLGTKIPKQFVEVLGKPIISYTIEIFEKHSEIDAIEIVCIKEYKELLEDIIKKYKYSKVRNIIDGGKNFQESVINSVSNLNGRIDDDDIILFHCAVSPIITDEIISDGIKVCKEKHNAVSATPFYMLSGYNDDGIKSTKYIDRDTIMVLTNPFTFKYGYIKELYKEAKEKNMLDKVDPHITSLMYALNKTVYFSKGSQKNIKITTKEDLELFEAYIVYKNK